MLSGRDKGKQGVVCVVAKRKNSVMVEGMKTVSETPTISIIYESTDAHIHCVCSGVYIAVCRHTL